MGNLVCKWHLIPWHIRCVGRILPPKKTTLNPAQQGQFLRSLHNLGMEWMEWPPSNPNLNFLNAWFISLAVLGEQHNKHNHAGWLENNAGWRMRRHPTTVHDQHGEEAPDCCGCVWFFWAVESSLSNELLNCQNFSIHQASITWPTKKRVNRISRWTWNISHWCDTRLCS